MSPRDASDGGPPRFGLALNDVVATHAGLRAGFTGLAGTPVQLIAPEAPLRTEVLSGPWELRDPLP